MGGSKNVYASVKAYSKKGKLLTKADFQTLAESRDLEELMTRIKNTVYGEAVSDVQKPFSSQSIESALRSKLADIHYSIAKTSGNSGVLDAYYMKFIISNLKLILKGKALGKAQEDIETHVNLHAEELIKQRDVVVKALVAKDFEEAVASLSSVQFGEEIAKAAALYNEKKNVQIIDTYFDKILYQHLVGAMKNFSDKEATKLVAMDIDFYNILSVIRGKFWGLQEDQIQDLIIPTSPPARELLGRMMAAGTVRDAFNELSSTKYKELVPQVENELDAIAEFERAFEMMIYRTSLRSFAKMFSFATVVGITKLTAFEVRNLAAIAFAVEQKIPTETTMSKLILEEE
ncbi:V-type ATP synthase subunit C protein [Marine Group I thaumarchaeote SCGC AAA799-E16]|uniref:V-type ATP synthase subunit C protein n=3 Tax=Marine Group I TaxID=905826 RepID=A0A087RMB4_9ARCH|nr:V-type ATP synthase subunit C protein [Marine Group I thaumarchaeote SCGC AAA799-E16]KFM14618.1 V-type ATP synthase subunit C protein [Marine Group I thaumarchaeote SCGC AAA799-D11]KFM16206.1 V-type H+-transporting ATPase subunit C protein [Marine Group I thaumarchaeote SCGC RSA3]